jgi:hypothetical protein
MDRGTILLHGIPVNHEATNATSHLISSDSGCRDESRSIWTFEKSSSIRKRQQSRPRELNSTPIEEEDASSQGMPMNRGLLLLKRDKDSYITGLAGSRDDAQPDESSSEEEPSPSKRYRWNLT